jgi:nucleoside-diphosphate-sugar epimerase
MKGAAALVSGGTGFVGRFIVERLITEGYDVAVLCRTKPPGGYFSRPVRFFAGTLDSAEDFSASFANVDFFVHAAFDHLPGRYRGGEGDDPTGFRRRNLEGSLRFFEAAKRAGVRRAVFLSSRAAYGEEKGPTLTEDMPCSPGSLYGRVKLATEEALAAMAAPDFATVSLRVTGVYGPAGRGRAHKWSELFGDYLSGRQIEPRLGSEVHGNDVAAAANLVLAAPAKAVSCKVFNVSDILVDRRDILEILREKTGSAYALPDRADASVLSVMATDKLRALGWRPGGRQLFRDTVEALVMEYLHPPSPRGL